MLEQFGAFSWEIMEPFSFFLNGMLVVGCTLRCHLIFGGAIDKSPGFYIEVFGVLELGLAMEMMTGGYAGFFPSWESLPVVNRT